MEDEVKESAGLARNMKRCNKQLMEKRRRERINVSLEQLKSLVLHATRKDSAQYSKLEKADILEMTVKHLRTLQQQQLAMAAASDSSVLLKFRAGFHECAGEVGRYLGTIDGLNPEVRNRLLHHLGSCSRRVGAVPDNRAMLGVHPHAHIQATSTTQLVTLPGSSPPQTLTASNLSIQVPAVSPQAVQLTGAFQVIPGTAFAPNVAYVLPSLSTMVSPHSVLSPTDSSGSLRSPSPSMSTGSSELSPRDSPPVDLSPRGCEMNICAVEITSHRDSVTSHEKHVKIEAYPNAVYHPQASFCAPVPAGGNLGHQPIIGENVWRPW